MLEFLTYLKENYKEDISSSEKIISEKWNKTVEVIKAAFDGIYTDKKLAIFKIQNEFVDNKIAPKNIDINFVKENMNYILDKINSLEEGDVKIIINTGDVQKGSTRTSVTGMETEGKKGKKKDVVKEEMDEVETADGEIEGEIDTGNVGSDEEEKVVKVSVEDNKVTVEPSENTGLEKSEHEFENEEEAKGFVDSLENLFKGFKVEKEESNEGESNEAGEFEGETEEESTKIKKQVVTEASEESKDSGEEPEDAGEEPEDAGEEPEDAGEEPEDAGEEPEDAGEIDWEDMLDTGEEEGDDAEEFVSPVRPIGSTELESLDLNKIINTLVRVENKWYKVNSISENNEVICIDKEGTENYFDLEQIEEMEQTLGELAKSAVAPNAGEEETEEPKEAEEESCPTDAEECVPCEKGAEEAIGSPMGLAQLTKALGPEMMQELGAWVENPEQDPSEELYDALMDFYADEMPYGIMKARTGDPYEWLLAKVTPLFNAEEESNPAEEETEEPESGETEEHEAEESEDEEEREHNQEESFSFAKIAAAKYFDLDEDALTAPSMANTQSGGLTSKPGVINQTITPVKPAPKTPVVKGPTAALTAKPSKPGEKVEKIPSAPTAPAKKGPQQALTAKPKAPPKKTETVKAPPKAPTKAAPKGSYTAKPGKPGEKHDKVKAPEIPSEYKKGGFKG